MNTDEQPDQARAGARTPGKHALLFILITIFIDTVSFGVIIPVLPKLIAELGEVSVSDAAVVGGQLMFVFALMQFVFAPVLGSLSDRFGRRPVLLLSLTVLGIDYIIMGAATTLFWLFVGRMLAGAAAATFKLKSIDCDLPVNYESLITVLQKYTLRRSNKDKN